MMLHEALLTHLMGPDHRLQIVQKYELGRDAAAKHPSGAPGRDRPRLEVLIWVGPHQTSEYALMRDVVLFSVYNSYLINSF